MTEARTIPCSEAVTVSSCAETEAVSVYAVENLDPVYGEPPAWAEVGNPFSSIDESLSLILLLGSI